MQQPVELVHRLFVGAAEWISEAVFSRYFRRPIGRWRRIAAEAADCEHSSSRELVDAFVDRMRRWNVVMAQENGQCAAVDVVAEIGMLLERLEL